MIPNRAQKKEIKNSTSKTQNVMGRWRWCVCPYLSVWTCPLGMDCGGRMSQVDRVAGSLNTSKHTHTSAFWPGGRHTESVPVGASPRLLYGTPVRNGRKEREGAEAQSVVLEVRWGHKKKNKEDGKSDLQSRVAPQKQRRKARQCEAEL